MSPWSTGLLSRDLTVVRDEAPLIRDKFSDTRLVLNEAGELWATTAGPNAQGVCLAYSVEHFDRLVELANKFREQFQTQVPASQQTVGD